MLLLYQNAKQFLEGGNSILVLLGDKTFSTFSNIVSFSLFSGVCWASGDPHYMTFDGKHFSFMGACTYILTENIKEGFTVHISNVPCGTAGMTCTKSVSIKIPGYEVSLLLGKGKFWKMKLIFVSNWGYQKLRAYQSWPRKYQKISSNWSKVLTLNFRESASFWQCIYIVSKLY